MAAITIEVNGKHTSIELLANGAIAFWDTVQPHEIPVLEALGLERCQDFCPAHCEAFLSCERKRLCG